MALVLSLKEGQDFFVGERRFVVTQLLDGVSFRLRDVAQKKSHEITDEHSTEILDDVFVSAGDYPSPGMARAVIDAPAKILILRGSKYRNQPEPPDEEGVYGKGL